MKAYLETQDEDGFIAFYESLPTDGEWSEEESKSSSDEMRLYFRGLLKEKRQRTIRRS
jgi:hypothetical protein